MDDRWSVECRQQVSTVEYVDNSKRRRRFYQSTGTPKRTEHNLFVRIGKSEGKASNDKRLIMCSMYCAVETNFR